MAHVPVLYNAVLAALQPRAGGRYIDGTVGAGGHAHGILTACAPDGRLLGLDRDPRAIAAAAERLKEFGERAALRQASYTQMAEAAPREGCLPADGILLDLGLSSLQMDDPARGFSFQGDGPLDMRFDPQAELTADEIVNHYPLDELADILYQFGEERLSRRIARAIGDARPIRSTGHLAEVIARAAGGRRARPGSRKRAGGRLHPATRSFQALRIAVNGELEAVEQVLPVALGLLKPGGRLAVIAFHSLEDRLVKRFCRSVARGEAPTAREVTRKPIEPDEDEIALNPRARSAKLRVLEKNS